jgi:rhamnosyltransferase subunit B
MARFLLGWELGGGRGHLVRLAELSRQLIGDGHEVVVAAQRLSPGFGFPPEARLWQAPVWPRLLSNVGALGGPNPNSMGDILVRLGLDTPDTLALLVGAWEEVLRSVQPDAVVADFAPALLSAARGRVPTVLAGLGFDAVPSHLASFPSLTNQPAVHSEADTLTRANMALRAAGLNPLDRLPQLFEADRVLAGTFTELDPYASTRVEAPVAPSVAHPLGEAGSGEEVFLYADPSLLRIGALWEGLVRSGLPVRVYAQGASATQQAELDKLGFTVERAAVPFAQVAQRSRVAMSSGGLGFVSSALAAGLPAVVVHYDLEKGLTGQAITRLQLGGHVHAGAIQPEAFATSLRTLYQNDGFQRRARELAPGFRARLQPTQEELVVKALSELVG